MSMMHEATASQLEGHRKHKERQIRLRAVAPVYKAPEPATVLPILAPVAETPKPAVVWAAPADECRAWMKAELAISRATYVLPRTVTAKAPLIIATVAKYFEISRVDLLSRRRDRGAVWPRHVAIYLIKSLTGSSLPAIGRLIGGRDHTTVINAVRKIKSLLLTEPAIAEAIATIAATLAESGMDVEPLGLAGELL